MSTKGEATGSSTRGSNSGPDTGKQKKQKPAETDPFGCNCGPCKRFWKENFSNVSVLSEPVLRRAQKTSTMFRPEQADWRIKKGDRVLVDGTHMGKVLFVGLLDENVIAPPVYVGVQCDENIGSVHNGMMNGKRYFHCPRGHGALVPYADVRPLNPPEKTPPLTGNFMFESYQEVVKTRALRRQKMESEYEQQVKSKPVTRLRPTRTVYDENDVAYKDSQQAGSTQVYHYANSTVKVRTGGAGKQKIDPQARRFARWKEEFGGGEKGDRLVGTLKKLHEAWNKGKNLSEEEIMDEEESLDPLPQSAHHTNNYNSKPPTRMSENPTQSTKSYTLG